jgi:hypothetical protein
MGTTRSGCATVSYISPVLSEAEVCASEDAQPSVKAVLCRFKALTTVLEAEGKPSMLGEQITPATGTIG